MYMHFKSQMEMKCRKQNGAKTRVNIGLELGLGELRNISNISWVLGDIFIWQMYYYATKKQVRETASLQTIFERYTQKLQYLKTPLSVVFVFKHHIYIAM